MKIVSIFSVVAILLSHEALSAIVNSTTESENNSFISTTTTSSNLMSVSTFDPSSEIYFIIDINYISNKSTMTQINIPGLVTNIRSLTCRDLPTITPSTDRIIENTCRNNRFKQLITKINSINEYTCSTLLDPRIPDTVKENVSIEREKLMQKAVLFDRKLVSSQYQTDRYLFLSKLKYYSSIATELKYAAITYSIDESAVESEFHDIIDEFMVNGSYSTKDEVLDIIEYDLNLMLYKLLENDIKKYGSDQITRLDNVYDGLFPYEENDAYHEYNDMRNYINKKSISILEEIKCNN